MYHQRKQTSILSRNMPRLARGNKRGGEERKVHQQKGELIDKFAMPGQGLQTTPGPGGVWKVYAYLRLARRRYAHVARVVYISIP